MTRAEQINQELQALSDAYAAAALGAAEFRRRRRELVCTWTGEPLPAADQVVEDATQPVLPVITDADLARAAAAAPPAGGTPSRQRWLTAVLLMFAVAGAALVVWFVLRR